MSNSNSPLVQQLEEAFRANLTLTSPAEASRLSVQVADTFERIAYLLNTAGEGAVAVIDSPTRHAMWLVGGGAKSLCLAPIGVSTADIEADKRFSLAEALTQVANADVVRAVNASAQHWLTTSGQSPMQYLPIVHSLEIPSRCAEVNKAFASLQMTARKVGHRLMLAPRGSMALLHGPLAKVFIAPYGAELQLLITTDNVESGDWDYHFLNDHDGQSDVEMNHLVDMLEEWLENPWYVSATDPGSLAAKLNDLYLWSLTEQPQESAA